MTQQQDATATPDTVAGSVTATGLTPMRSKGDTPNPWEFGGTDSENREVLVSLPWDSISRALGDATTRRDDGCLYRTFLVGVGPDGTPDSTPTQFGIPEGLSQIPQATLNGVGLTTIDDILAQQVTLGF